MRSCKRESTELWGTLLLGILLLALAVLAHFT